MNSGPREFHPTERNIETGLNFNMIERNRLNKREKKKEEENYYVKKGVAVDEMNGAERGRQPHHSMNLSRSVGRLRDVSRPRGGTRSTLPIH